MAGLCFLVGITILMLSVVRGREIAELIMERMDSLEDDLDDVEKQVNNRIDITKLSLRSELKQHIKQHVREAMAELLKGESIEEMVRSQIVSEVRQPRQGNHQMKRQLQHVLKYVTDIQGEVKTYKEALRKAEKDAIDLKMCSNHIVDSKILQRDLEQFESNIAARDRKLYVNDEEIKKLKHDLKMSNEVSQQNITVFTTPSAEASTSTSVVTTRKPIEERSRLLVAPYSSSTQQKLRQLNIHSNSISNYALQSLKYVTSFAYMSKLKKLLIGVYSPYKILSSQLDSYSVTTVRENVQTHGMAVDEERELVFMTTHSPRKSISRMTTHGKHFTVMIDLKNFRRYPYSVAVNTKKKTIYVGMYYEVIVVSYDGRVLQTLTTGTSMFAVTLDTTGGNLYYNDDKKVMKLSLSQNVTTELAVLSVTPFNLAYYRNTVYSSSHGPSTGVIGAVDVGTHIVSYTLQNVNTNSGVLMLCLVP